MGSLGLHPRLTVLPAGAQERSSLTELLARRFAGAPAITTVRGTPLQPVEPLDVLGIDDLETVARDVAQGRIEEHARLRDELTAHLRQAREHQAVTGNRRDEAAARARRLSSHLAECDSLLEHATELTRTADEAQRNLDERRADLEQARDRMALVQEQRDAATRAIEDASAQLQDLEAAELDESTLRRELEKAGHELRAAEEAHADATAAVQELEAQATERLAAREQLDRERAELVARIESPLYDPQPVQAALAAFDAESDPDQGDPMAQELAREWVEVEEELTRIESALPAPPSDDQLTTAQHNLQELEQLVAELEATSGHARLHPAAREQIEAAHEAVLDAEEILDQSGGHPDAAVQLEEARMSEQQVLASYGYETYLDLVMSEPEPDAAQAELIEVLRARRVAEDTLASLWAAAEPPQIVLTLRSRRERIFGEAAELLCCDPGENVVELLYSHPAVPQIRTRELADALGAYGIYPVGTSVRDTALEFLDGLENEVAARNECWSEIERIDADAVAFDEDDARDAEQAERLIEAVHRTALAVDAANERVQALERELVDRTSHDDRRLARVAAAEQLRAQIAAVTEALERSDAEYHNGVADAEAAATAAEASLERATAALTDAIRKLRRIGEALPPALRPKRTDDALGELPMLRETLAGEVERAEVALASATRDLERARADIDQTQAQLDSHLTVTPTADVLFEDLRQAVGEMISRGAEDGTTPVVLDDPFVHFEDEEERIELLDALADASARRPVILLTDHVEILGWAIGLPDDVGAVTSLPQDDPPDPSVPVPLPVPKVADRPGAVAPGT